MIACVRVEERKIICFNPVFKRYLRGCLSQKMDCWYSESRNMQASEDGEKIDILHFGITCLQAGSLDLPAIHGYLPIWVTAWSSSSVWTGKYAGTRKRGAIRVLHWNSRFFFSIDVATFNIQTVLIHLRTCRDLTLRTSLNSKAALMTSGPN